MALALKSLRMNVAANRTTVPASLPHGYRLRIAARVPTRKLVVRASAEPTAEPTNATLQKAQETAAEAWTWVKAKWEGTADSEKPAVVAILVGVIVAQIAIGATIDVVDRIPVVNSLLQLLGLGVTGYYAVKLSTDPEERATVKSSVAGFLEKVTGGDK